MAGMQHPNTAAMGAVPQQHPPTVPSQQAPQVQPQAAQQQTQQTTHHQQHQVQDHDPITKVKTTVALLKESLKNLMKVSAQAFAHSAAIDNASKNPEETAVRFDKSLEEFYSLCDQLELYLRLGHDCTTQYMEGARYTPIPLLQSNKQETAPTEALTYGQYIATVKAQIQCASEVHNALLDCCQKLGHSGQT